MTIKKVKTKGEVNAIPPTVTQVKLIQEQLWRQGQLSWKLNSAQKKIYDVYHRVEHLTPVFQQSRRSGKSWTLLILALEQALRVPDSIVHYAAPTGVMARKIIIPTMRMILKDAPRDVVPRYLKNEGVFEFNNGSRIEIVGVDEGNADRLRGSSTNLAIVDEAGFIVDLEYVVNDILVPQTSGTGAKVVLSSTSPVSIGHPFYGFLNRAEIKNASVSLTVYDVLELTKDDPEHLRRHLNRKTFSMICEQLGGEDSATWRREYCNERITDSDRAVLPEFTDTLARTLVDQIQKPGVYDAYVSMDPGTIDYTGILFGYYHPELACLIIEDEWMGAGSKITSESIAAAIRDKESLHFIDNFTGKSRVYMRVSDNDPILLNDMTNMHKLNFIPARKDNREGAINDLRIKLINKKIIINPRCTNLVVQMKAATWNKGRTQFTRQDGMGHFDLVAALYYLVRMVQWNKLPRQPNQGLQSDTFSSNINKLNHGQQGWVDMFTKKRN